MGKNKGIKSSRKEEKKKRVRMQESESSDNESTAPTPDSSKGEGIDNLEKAILDLRERGKKDPNLDFVRELRKIQDHISDLKGDERRPITAVVSKIDKKKTKKKKDDETCDESKSSDESDKEEEDDDDDEDDDDEEEESDPYAGIKELINKRLTTCMMLALSFESDTDYPKDFYQKLSDSNKFKEVSQPFKKEEMQMLNQMLKERKHIAKKRLNDCNR